MQVRNYLAKDDGSGKIYFEGISRPWPEFQGIVEKRQTSDVVTVPGFDSGTSVIIPGNVLTFDFGVPGGSGSFEVRVPLVTTAMVLGISAIWHTVKNVRYSPDDGLSIYLCAWAEDGYTLVPPPGFSDTSAAQDSDYSGGGFEIRLRLKVKARIT